MLASLFKIIANYVLVQTCIILFIAPFYWLYRRRYVPDSEVKVSLNQHIEYFFSSRYANWLVFFWAMSEALVWFVIPEFLLVLLIFMRIRRKRELLLYDIYGTTAGTALAYIVHLPESAIARLPYIQPSMVLHVKHWYAAHGLLGLAYQPFSGVPYKVFTHLAPHYHYFFPAFLVLAVLFRMSRYYIVYLIMAGSYPVFHKYVYRHYVRLFFIATFIFSVLLLKVYSSYGPHHHVGYMNQRPSTAIART